MEEIVGRVKLRQSHPGHSNKRGEFAVGIPIDLGERLVAGGFWRFEIRVTDDGILLCPIIDEEEGKEVHA